MSDLIRKKDAVSAISDLLINRFDEKVLPTWNDVYHAIDSIPSAEPERKKGEWIWRLADNGWADHICSECGWIKNTDIHVHMDYNYCPNCGSDMRGDR